MPTFDGPMTFTAAALALAALLAPDALAPRVATAADGAESSDTYGMCLYTNTRRSKTVQSARRV